jgi:pyrroline-5-carboxylate reductase
MTQLGFVGAGNMARAIGAGLVRSRAAYGLAASDTDPGQKERFRAETGGTAMPDNLSLVEQSEVILLAVKPQVMAEVLAEIAPAIRSSHLVISIAAGIPLATLSRALGAATRTVRVMPNMPALIGKGMSVLVGGARATREDLVTTEKLFAGIGEVVVIGDEALMDAVTAVSGSGPGFLFAFAESLIDAAQDAGLSAELAVTLVEQTLYGAATLLRQTPEPAAKLRAMVSSPGGTTLAGLDALAAGHFAETIRSAIRAATRRSRELSQS